MLSIRNLHASYGMSDVLFGVDLDVGEGEVVALLGRNGMGKTTTVMSTLGLMPSRGEVRLAGKRIDVLQPFRIARAGIGLVPEGRRIFPNLTVKENLVATAENRRGASNPWTLATVIELFPRLGERLGNQGNRLSGGEQQMVAIARALMTNPQVLILDEATEGLAPLIRLEIWQCLRRLKSLGQSILVIDKNLGNLLEVADRHCVLEKGRVVWTGTSAALKADPDAQHRYLGV
ncbi:branched-chain amino acid transport system ATP-binding protein [Variovorax boronicumulans]|jgi:branched-chain amino acid transport system ATP-binding protein|uniref:ABC transporter ATP-binding protein n=1 Tax=Variovorax boronicumulans TaxID=436515 RepID=UPI00278B7B0D|nr:ABC transporter ATP-binding protein [Variovorax boronicumulans]MDP9995205.1 branched-chain amino acid transport system ATP-binding protein [Variovorax boronicumulans]MDQ0006495.1 branched-chain amino acid transport system ATP-binding protein [Variovorax boronicumulans]MDQ0038427.1 branched-chain amino acid transport system ATP-binding protein [Variovorax boronicumulans]